MFILKVAVSHFTVMKNGGFQWLYEIIYTEKNTRDNKYK